MRSALSLTGAGSDGGGSRLLMARTRHGVLNRVIQIRMRRARLPEAAESGMESGRPRTLQSCREPKGRGSPAPQIDTQHTGMFSARWHGRASAAFVKSVGNRMLKRARLVTTFFIISIELSLP